MDDVVGAFQKVPQIFGIRNIGFDDLNVVFEGFHIFTLARRKVIDNLNCFVPAKEFLNNVRSDETAATCNDIDRHR